MPSTTINAARLILGGVVAGILIYFFEGAIHMGLLMNDWNAWHKATQAVIHGPDKDVSMALWAACSLVTGMIGIWVYTGIRPRYGAGPKTALLAGFLVWAATHFTGMLDTFALGTLPHKIVTTEAALMLIGLPLAVLAGAYFYKE